MTLLKDDAPINLSTYFGFRLLLKGKQFQSPDGKILTKLDVWNEHKRFPDMLRNIASGRNREYIVVDKPGWKDGCVCG